MREKTKIEIFIDACGKSSIFCIILGMAVYFVGGIAAISKDTKDRVQSKKA